ncbi:hypothetical protein KCP74_01830 [Salmonella enterica subsp. enterica]|nr:hypothetical protein KCP74_01830 [Salmonella enterica subsp. enterica]
MDLVLYAYIRWDIRISVEKQNTAASYRQARCGDEDKTNADSQWACCIAKWHLAACEEGR